MPPPPSPVRVPDDVGEEPGDQGEASADARKVQVLQVVSCPCRGVHYFRRDDRRGLLPSRLHVQFWNLTELGIQGLPLLLKKDPQMIRNDLPQKLTNVPYRLKTFS